MKQRLGENEEEFADGLVRMAKKLPMASLTRQRMVMHIFCEGVSDFDLRAYFLTITRKILSKPERLSRGITRNNDWDHRDDLRVFRW